MVRKTRSKAKELKWSKDNALELEEQSVSNIIVSEAEEMPAAAANAKKKKTTKKAKKKSKSLKSPTPVTSDVDGNVTSDVETGNNFTDIDVEDEELDDALRVAEMKLQKLKRKEIRLRQIKAESTKLKKEFSSSKSKPSKVTSKNLRSMQDVAAEVDRLMDKKELKFKDCSSSSASSGEYSDPDTSKSSLVPDTSDSENEIVRKKKKSKSKMKKSGKNKKLTSSVKHPQEYPHSNLKFHFVGKEKKYDELSIAEFCAGYMSIVKSCERAQRKARIDHLEELMYHATTRPWKSVLNYHAACVLEIERGNLKWGDNFQMHGLQSITLTETFAHARGSNMAGKQQSGEKSMANDNRAPQPTRFCKNFQRGTCQFDRDHYGYLNNERHYLKHICGNCWVYLKKQSPHSEQSETCPLFNAQL